MGGRTRASPIDPANVPTGVMARLLGISSNTLTKYTADGRCSKNARGKYDLENTIQDYLKYATGKSDAVPQKRSKQLDEQTRKLRLANDQAAGILMSTTDASAIWVEYCARLRAGLASLSGRNASKLSGMSDTKKIRALIDEEIQAFFSHAEAAIPELAIIDGEAASNDASGANGSKAKTG